MSVQYEERKEYFKQYIEMNKERLQQKRHDYYEENKDRIKEYAKQWKQDNPSMAWLQKQEYFEKNKDKINEYRRRKYAENKEDKNICMLLYYSDISSSQLSNPSMVLLI